MKKIAWIGTGVMGRSMLINLKNQGHQVWVYNRSKAKVNALASLGFIVADTIAEAIEQADIVFTMVGYPSDVEEVYLSKQGIFAHGKQGLLAIDMTTSSPSLAAKLYDAGRAKGIRVMDAPVSGGDSGAKNATLSIMVGGDKEDFDQAHEFFAVLGKNILHMGPAGSGQHTKMANQIAVAGAVSAMTEALVYAQHVGLDQQKMLDAISGGAAGSWQLSNTAPRTLKKDFAPGFFIKHFVKDMRLAKESMAEHGVSLDMLNAVCAMYEAMVEHGHENDGTQALVKYYNEK